MGSKILTLHPGTNGTTEHRATSINLSVNLLKIRKIIDSQQFVAEELKYETLAISLADASALIEHHRLQLLEHLDLLPVNLPEGESDETKPN